MPNAPEDYSHLLDVQQKATAEAAAQQGRAFDTRGQALANMVGRFEDPHQALQYLSEASNPLQTRKTELETRAASGTTLSAAETTELARINGQLAGTASISADVVREISQAKATRFEEYRNQGVQSLDGLRGTVEGLRISAETAKNQRDAARRMYPTTDPNRAEKLKPFEDAARMAEARHKEADAIYNDMNAQAAQRQAREQAKTAREQADTRREGYKEASLDELTSTQGTLEARLARIAKDLRNPTLSAEEKNSLRAEQKQLTTERDEVSDLVGQKQIEDAGEINSELSKKAEALTRARSDRAAVEGNISNRETKIDGIRTQIKTLRDELEGTGLSAKERSKKQGELYNLTRQLKAEEETLSLDQARLQEIETGEQAEVTKFRDMDPIARAEELKKVLQDEDLSGLSGEAIMTQLLAHQRVNKQELAAFGEYMVQEMLQGRREHLCDFQQIMRNRPELRKYFTDKITESRQFDQFVRREFPTNWQRVMDFARDHPGWLMLILAILAGTVVGPAALAGAGVNLMKR